MKEGKVKEEGKKEKKVKIKCAKCERSLFSKKGGLLRRLQQTFCRQINVLTCGLSDCRQGLNGTWMRTNNEKINKPLRTCTCTYGIRTVLLHT